MTGVKICGVTRLEDALLAVRAGADSIGFNFHPRSKRFIPPELAAPIVAALPRQVASVGVFVDAEPAVIEDAMRVSGVRIAQLHGRETPAQAEVLRCPVIKAFAASEAVAEAVRAFRVWAVLLDADAGGSGRTFDWSLAASVPRDVPLYLAGGLTPENVRAAVAQVRPAFVDVASGVEDSPGIKNPEKLVRFIAAAKES